MGDKLDVSQQCLVVKKACYKLGCMNKAIDFNVSNSLSSLLHIVSTWLYLALGPVLKV